MEVKILSEDKGLLQIEIEGESHTLCNVIREELWNFEDTSSASYNIKHPQISNPVLAVKSKKGKPKKLILDAVASLKEKTKKLRTEASKLK